jgi:hypothetical protein
LSETKRRLWYKLTAQRARNDLSAPLFDLEVDMRNLILAFALVVCSGAFTQAHAGVKFHQKRHSGHELLYVRHQPNPAYHSLSDAEAAENAELYIRGRLVAPYGGAIWAQ